MNEAVRSSASVCRALMVMPCRGWRVVASRTVAVTVCCFKGCRLTVVAGAVAVTGLGWA